MRYWIEIDLYNYEPPTDRLEVSDDREQAEAALVLARRTWNDGGTVVVRVGTTDPLVLGAYDADDVLGIRLVDTRDLAALQAPPPSPAPPRERFEAPHSVC